MLRHADSKREWRVGRRNRYTGQKEVTVGHLIPHFKCVERGDGPRVGTLDLSAVSACISLFQKNHHAYMRSVYTTRRSKPKMELTDMP